MPNILLILNDDMGYSDIGCYGGEVQTPNLDRLASDGLRFTQFYNTARCCPTRASILTGLHPHQASVGHMMDDLEYEGYRGNLNHRAVTIAEALQLNGYATYMSGKWHITHHTNPDGDKRSWPCQRGFDEFFGIITGAANYWKPQTLTRNNKALSVDDLPEDFFLTDAISDQAADYIRDHTSSKPDQPFFLYTAFTAPHWPLHAHEEDIARYKGRFSAGWDKLREERLERLHALGILDSKWGLSDRDSSQVPWDDVENKAWQEKRMEVYAAQIDRMDQGIGRIINALKETGQLEDTMIIFLADNGGCAEELGDQSVRNPIMAPPTTRDGRPVKRGNNPEIMPGPEETYQSYGIPWANLSNTPFREYKHWVHEGGISTPLIAHWPARISDIGALRHQPGQLTDIMATILDVTNTPYPKSYSGNEILPLEGVSIQSIFDDQPNDKETLIWEHEGNCAVRQGKWKLVCKYPGNWELYDLEADRSELNDLAGSDPERVASMAAVHKSWTKRCDVQPWGNVLAKQKEQRIARATGNRGH
ncbi:MAG: arylsulfatase [Candidatus Latescibacterota bacterium]|nr:arylsulfatase [Candidatus Latescibacterota bacterium]